MKKVFQIKEDNLSGSELVKKKKKIKTNKIKKKKKAEKLPEELIKIQP